MTIEGNPKIIQSRGKYGKEEVPKSKNEGRQHITMAANGKEARALCIRRTFRNFVQKAHLGDTRHLFETQNTTLKS